MRPGFLAIVLALTAGTARAGTTRCWLENGALVAPAAFGALAGDFVIDLSAPVSRLHVTAAEAAGIDAPSARRTLVIAGERNAGATLQLADLDARSAGFVTSIVGVLGADALAPFVIDVRPSPCVLTLSRRPAALTGGVSRLRVRQIAGAPAIAAAISDGVGARVGWFALDTGSWPVRVADARLTREPPPGPQPPVRLRALSLRGRLYEQIDAAPMQRPSPGLAGTIGQAVLSGRHWRLDARRGWFELWP